MKMKKLTILVLLTSVILAQQIPSSVIRGLNDQLDKVKTEIQEQNLGNKELSSSQSPNTITIKNSSEVSDTIKNSSEVSESPFFGYNYFNRDIKFFDNIPTPKDFILGPGDEVILSIWGETNIRRNFTINKDGLIFYENIGFISLANKTIEEAASTLKNEFSKFILHSVNLKKVVNYLLNWEKLNQLMYFLQDRLKILELT